MVYYFTSNGTEPPATIYVGKDKFESPLLFLSLPILPMTKGCLANTPAKDEELIKYGWEEDVWYQFFFCGPLPPSSLPFLLFLFADGLRLL